MSMALENVKREVHEVFAHPPKVDVKTRREAGERYKEEVPVENRPTEQDIRDAKDREPEQQPSSRTGSRDTSPHLLTSPKLRPPPPDTPSGRTGPPRSLSYHFSHTHGSPSISRANTQDDGGPLIEDEEQSGFPFNTNDQTLAFRSALDNALGGESSEKRGRKGESKLFDGLNPLTWFQESPKEEKEQFDFPAAPETGGQPTESNAVQETEDQATPLAPSIEAVSAPKRRLMRSFSSSQVSSNGPARWNRLRSLLPNVVNQAQSAKPQQAQPSVVTSNNVNLADELITGGLSALMLKLWLDRDDKDQRRIPILFHRLRIRVSDSLHPLHGSKAVFRIECEYANGSARWVIYRQLRDFVSLHTHYSFSNAFQKIHDEIPEFPKTSLPYFKFLKKQGREKGDHVGQIEFARLQREALENYLIALIRAVMFHPSSNRLAGFLEISALSIALARSGGHQYKAGYLSIESSGSKGGGFGRKGTSWKQKKASRWCVIRENYLVVLEEPGELTVWDVFLLDPAFKIERPKRYYRQTFNLFHSEAHKEALDRTGATTPGTEHDHGGNALTAMGTLTHKLAKTFHIGHHHGHRQTKSDGNLARNSNLLAATGHDHDSDSGSSDASSSASSSIPSRPTTPMLDPSTNANPLSGADEHPDEMEDKPWKDMEADAKKKRKRASEVSKHTFYIENAQMRLKLFARNQRQMLQWITALEKAAAASHYTGSNRFDSFAPIRLNVATQWLVDGRDYFWNVSRAILLARDVIYIHDWWLSPELQMRRPNKAKYRLDRLLERKAKEGVKIYVIVYQEVSNRTTPTDSNYTKQRITSLHPNIMLQRSPSHFQTGTFYWAHHEKMCVIDQTIAFMGGIDLCFGRWDTPQHALVDDPDEDDPEGSQIWPGKDYSNPRISDFHTLNKPDEDMYNRHKVGRMPWHDVGLQVVGQPARDLCRHFVERWNYLLRIKNHTRTMPFLIPPPEFKPGELQEMGLTGTCEMQICRSAGPWSLGTPGRVEHSIQNAYLKGIQMSEHFVYIENQFFITSTVVNDVKVENKIGDALVHRIIRAHREGTAWKCCIIVPVIPGFAYPVDHTDASAIRIIMELTNRTISRGPNSIFARLRKEGIDPDDYISVFSLRNWAKLRGDVLTTEQVYIHGKTFIVDDRLVIIGSANINERSQRGDRDSEIAAVIRDTDMIDCTMAGKPFQVGRFAHTLRIRLMREHLGVDVDAISEDDLMASEPVQPEHSQEKWDPDTEQTHGRGDGITMIKQKNQRTPAGQLFHTVVDGVEQAIHGGVDASGSEAAKALRWSGIKSKGLDNTAGDEALDEERKMTTRDGKKEEGFPSSIVPTLEEKFIAENLANGNAQNDSMPSDPTKANDEEAQARGAMLDGQAPSGTELKSMKTEDGRELYGALAHAQLSPATDDRPPHAQDGEGFDDADKQEQEAVGARSTIRKHLVSKLNNNKQWVLPTPRPIVDPDCFEDPISDDFWKKVWIASAVHNTEIFRKVFHAIPDDLVTTWKQYTDFIVHHERLNKPLADSESMEPVACLPSEAGDQDALGEPAGEKDGSQIGQQLPHQPPPGQPATSDKGPKPFDKAEREEMERLLGELNGHLVVYCNRFLEGEDVANNFLFNADRLLPMPIYN